MTRRAASRALALSLLLASSAACEMDPGDVLDEPRVLAIRADPPTRTAGEATTLTALVFGTDDLVRWQGCTRSWTAADPVVCEPGALSLGSGNPLTLQAEAEPDDLWLRADVADALPAVRKLATEGAATNPELVGIARVGGGEASGLSPGETAQLVVVWGQNQDPTDLVVTWYTTGGVIDPARTVESDAVSLRAPDEPGPVTVIGVARDQGGGVAWAMLTLDVGP